MIIDVRLEVARQAIGGNALEPTQEQYDRAPVEEALIEKLNEPPERGGGVFTDGRVFVFSAEVPKPEEARTVFDALPPDQAEAVVRYVLGASDRALVPRVGGSTAEEHIQRVLTVVEDERNRVTLG